LPRRGSSRTRGASGGTIPKDFINPQEEQWQARQVRFGRVH
jgi:hypothetical protein